MCVREGDRLKDGWLIKVVVTATKDNMTYKEGYREVWIHGKRGFFGPEDALPSPVYWYSSEGHARHAMNKELRTRSIGWDKKADVIKISVQEVIDKLEKTGQEAIIKQWKRIGSNS